MIKTRQDNDMIDHIGAVYTKIETEFSWPIWQDAMYHENHTG